MPMWVGTMQFRPQQSVCGSACDLRDDVGRNSLGIVREGKTASGITGQVLRPMGRRSGGRWQVGVGGHRGRAGIKPRLVMLKVKPSMD